MLKKTVLCAAEGGYKLIEVEFGWRPGDAVPRGSAEMSFDTAAEAMTELARRGRTSTRVHLDSPETPRPAAENPFTRAFVSNLQINAIKS